MESDGATEEEKEEADREATDVGGCSPDRSVRISTLNRAG